MFKTVVLRAHASSLFVLVRLGCRVLFQAGAAREGTPTQSQDYGRTPCYIAFGCVRKHNQGDK